MASATIRPVEEGDLPQVAVLAEAFNVSIGKPPGRYSAAVLHDVVFGPGAFVSILVAAAGETVMGYATYHVGFDPFLAAPNLTLADLYVAPDRRSRGLGRRLMAAVAADGAARGMSSLWWGVDDGNVRGQAFYKRLGARDASDRVYIIDGAAFQALAGGDGTSD